MSGPASPDEPLNARERVEVSKLGRAARSCSGCGRALLNIAEKARWGFAVVSGGRYFQVLPPRTGSVYHWVMAERAMPAQSPSRYAAVAALFAALEELMDDYRSLPDADHVRQWSEDADRITGEVARHLAVARARISAASPHDAR